MTSQRAINIWGVLHQKEHQDIYKLLMKHKNLGLTISQMSECLNVPILSLLAHLSELLKVEIVHSQHQAGSIVYKINWSTVQGFLQFKRY